MHPRVATPTSQNIIIPSAAAVDYTDCEAVYDYYRRLAYAYQNSGGMASPRRDSHHLRQLDSQGRRWLELVKPLLELGTTAMLPELIEAYDFIHRLSRQEPATAYCNHLRAKAAARWAAGDIPLTQTDVVLMLWPALTTDAAIAGRYAVYCYTVQQAWITELERYGRFRGITIHEAHKRLAHLLKQDLYAYLPGTDQQRLQTKRRWLAAYPENRI